MLWSGKWRPLDSLDFARRNAERAWPFGPAEIEPSVQAVFGFVWRGDQARARRRGALDRWRGAHALGH
jgi:hypothetical protein